MNFLFALLGSCVAASGTLPYIRETIKGKTKPRIVSWLTWTLLMCVATAGALADHQINSALFSLLGALATGTVVIVGWSSGNRSFALLDVICMIGVVIGIILWQVLNKPAIAICAAIIIDFVGLIPTLFHAWKAPMEETLTTYILIGVGGFLTVGASVASNGWSIGSVGYPIYAAASMSIVAGIVSYRKQRK